MDGNNKRKEDTKKNHLHIRTTDSQTNMIDELCYWTGKNKTDSVMESVRIVLNMKRNNF